jgi:aminomethyltransferase
VVNRHREFGVLAVQGPKASEVLQELGLPTDMDYMAFEDATWNSLPVRVCRTGYTGEQGYELIPSADDVKPLFLALLAAVRSRDGQVCGLGARDTLRTEMGYPLHGHELAQDISPLEARCGWAIGWNKDSFWGKDALTAQKADGPARILRGLKALDRGVLRPGLTVRASGRDLGTTTSGTFSPTLKVGIALALLDAQAAPAVGSEVEVDVRGRALRCEVVAPPFVVAKTR